MAATLTLSRVEQSAVHRHLETVYGRLCAQHPPHVDCEILHRVMVRLQHDTTVGLTMLEGVVMLRHLRVQQQLLGRDMMALEERRTRGGYNGTLDAAYRALDADSQILADVIRRLWEAVT